MGSLLRDLVALGRLRLHAYWYWFNQSCLKKARTE